MATKTKTANTTKTKPAAKSKPAAKAKPAAEPVAETRREEGHRIQAAMNAGPVTVAQLVERTGLSLERVTSHVEYEIRLQRASINSKKQVVATSSPKRRNRA